jgi:hypothetical protein
MLRSHLTSRTVQVSILGAMITLCSAPKTSHAERPKGDRASRVCAFTYRTAMQIEVAGHLREAKETYLACAKPACGVLIRNQCSARYTQLESDIPSVVPLVTDETGRDRSDVQVTMDSELLTSRVDGRALPVDPGPHEFSVIADGAILARRKVMILQGQRNRPIALALNQGERGKKAPVVTTEASVEAKPFVETPPDRPTVEKPAIDKTEPDRNSPEKVAPGAVDKVSSGPGVAPYILGGVGLLGIGTWGALTYWGRKDNEELSACAPSCSQASVDHVRNLYIAADVSLAVGAAALGTSIVLFIVNPGSKEKPPSQASYRFDVQPARSGAFATVSGVF